VQDRRKGHFFSDKITATEAGAISFQLYYIAAAPKMASHLLLLRATPCPRVLIPPLAKLPSLRTNKCAPFSKSSSTCPPFTLHNGLKDNMFLLSRFQFDRRRGNSITCFYNAKEKPESVSSDEVRANELLHLQPLFVFSCKNDCLVIL
jgi:hypothetical protein